MADEEDEARLVASIRPELRAGLYSNFVGVWHSPNEFTLDFLVTDMPQEGEDGVPEIPAEVVARIKIPTSVIFNLARAIADNVTKYESKFGPITPVPNDSEPLYPPRESGHETKEGESDAD